MAIKQHLRIDTAFNSSSMSDLVFLLLIFFMITSTMISPNALKLLLPQSSNQVQAKPAVSVSIRQGDPFFYIDGNHPVALRDLEYTLLKQLQNREDPTISIHAERSVPIDEVVKVMNVAKGRKWKVILATSPENK